MFIIPKCKSVDRTLCIFATSPNGLGREIASRNQRPGGPRLGTLTWLEATNDHVKALDLTPLYRATNDHVEALDLTP